MGAYCRVVTLAVLISFVGLSGVCAGDPPKTEETLQSELLVVRQQIAEARTNLVSQGKALWSQQHGLEYADPECAQLKDEIKSLESQIIEKRRQLDARLKAKESIRAIDDQRKQLVETLRALTEKERLILNEIAALGNSESPRQEIDNGSIVVEPTK